MATTIYLIRHAQSNPSISLEESAWPLSERGKEQAKTLPELLGPLGIEQLFSSRYLRCLETVRPYSKASDLNISLREGLQERNISNGIDRNFYEIWRRSWEDFSYAKPGCESSMDAQTRFVATVHGILAEPVKKTIGICTHGNVIGLFLNAIDRRFGIVETEALRTPDVVKVVADDGHLTVDRAFHLPDLDAISTDHRDTPIDMGTEPDLSFT